MTSLKENPEEVTLIRTKLKMPWVSPDLVDRPHLIERLNQGLSGKVILVSAPAGYGKTTLAATWLRSRSRARAWISLSEADDDLALFLGYLVAAIETAVSDACPATRSFLQADQLPPVETIASTLINEFAALPTSEAASGLLLVLDDFHCLRNQDIHQVLGTLIEHQPKGLCLVLLSRQDPFQLPIVQLRARREITELRQADLRFSLAETKIYVSQVVGADLTDHVISTLDRSVEGWAAGLQLASLSLPASGDAAAFVQTLPGRDRNVMEYLTDEVLTRQPQTVQTFLLETSILDRLSGPLCEALLGRGAEEQGSRGEPDIGTALSSRHLAAAGQQMLEQLERANLFLIPLDDHHEWYRYHHLFQELLVGKLKADYSSAEIRALNLRASRWFAVRGTSKRRSITLSRLTTFGQR